jgi:hypothetical protein
LGVHLWLWVPPGLAPLCRSSRGLAGHLPSAPAVAIARFGSTFSGLALPAATFLALPAATFLTLPAACLA